MTIQELFQEAGVGWERLHDAGPVHGMTMDSRRVKPGSMFACMPPATERSRDSHEYLGAARSAGAGSALVYSDGGFEAAIGLGMGAALLGPERYSDALWILAKVAFGNPSAAMKVIGVTGTNGKTTTAWLIRDMLLALGSKAAYLGTLGFQIPGEERELQNTTPFAIELNELLAEARDAGVEAIAMEVSSHALAERRVDGVEFDAAVFTNLTQDHLDFHGSMEDYEAAKMRLFTELPLQSRKAFRWAANLDDAAGRRVAERMTGPGVSFGASEGALRVDAVEIGIDHLLLDFHADEEIRVRTPLGGAYNVENSSSAVAGMLALGYSLREIGPALAKVRPVPGRFEPVPNDAGIGILVDYAHTPDALEKLLDAVRPLTQGRIITVFGCGGDRDRNKRPKMAKAASERSDLTIVTSDNPRTEDPQAILDEVRGGLVPGAESLAISDRGEAIGQAIRMAKPGDVVVIAGKGHENYQIIGRTKHPMDDRELARQGLRTR